MEKKHFIKNHLLLLLVAAAWALLVLYPNPVHLLSSIYRLKNPPVMPLQVSELAIELKGAAPHEIEQFVYKQIPYQFDWEVYNMPWYFPTLEEALEKENGDCKARYLLFASLLEEMEIPYQKNISLTHIWVGYEGKAESRLENSRESMIMVDEYGRIRITLPRPDMERSSQNFVRGFWDVMPAERKVMLLGGYPFIFGIFALQPLTGQHYKKPFFFLE